MAIDKKYGKVVTEHGSIGEDEPVVVFRAQDILLPKVLMYYRLFCTKAGSPRGHLDLIDDAREEVVKWQRTNAPKIPSSAFILDDESSSDNGKMTKLDIKLIMVPYAIEQGIDRVWRLSDFLRDSKIEVGSSSKRTTASRAADELMSEGVLNEVATLSGQHKIMSLQSMEAAKQWLLQNASTIKGE